LQLAGSDLLLARFRRGEPALEEVVVVTGELVDDHGEYLGTGTAFSIL
jgi:hypothetical protein